MCTLCAFQCNNCTSFPILSLHSIPLSSQHARHSHSQSLNPLNIFFFLFWCCMHSLYTVDSAFLRTVTTRFTYCLRFIFHYVACNAFRVGRLQCVVDEVDLLLAQFRNYVHVWSLNTQVKLPLQQNVNCKVSNFHIWFN